MEIDNLTPDESASASFFIMSKTLARQSFPFIFSAFQDLSYANIYQYKYS